MSKLLAALRETRSRIRRALVCIAQARDEDPSFNLALDETKTALENALMWVDEAIEQEDTEDGSSEANSA
jgi:hypothetical protein